MASKNNPKKTGYSKLGIYRVANEELGKNKRNNYSNIIPSKKPDHNQINLKPNEQTNIKNPPKDDKSINNGKNSRNKSQKHIQNYSTVVNGAEGMEPSNQTKKNNLKAGNISKDKDKDSNSKKRNHTFKAKPVKKKHIDHIERIIIDLVSNDDDATVKTDSNYYENEHLYRSYMNKAENKDDASNLENKDNNISNKVENLPSALNIVENRWRENCVLINELQIPLLSDEISQQKKEIELIINKWKKSKF